MEKEITGVMFYYYYVCKRKLWYFYHEITMEQNSENVLIGKLLDEESYSRNDKHINIDNVINIDYIKSDEVLHEIKKSRKIEEASIMQVKYYLYYLKKRGVKGVTGKIDYPLLKQTLDVFLEDEDIEEIEIVLKHIKGIVNFEKRIMHPPDNMINTLISFVNSVIYTKVLSEVYMTQLNPTISYLHEPSERRFSLCLDIAEIFKPIIGDRLIFSLLNKKQITEKSFTKGLNRMHLTKEASALILREIDNKLLTTIKHKELNKVVTYQYLMRLECYKLVKHLLGEKEYDGFRIWW